MLAIFSRVESEVPYLSLEKDNFGSVFTKSIEWAHEIRNFHVGRKKRDTRAKLLFCWYKPIIYSHYCCHCLCLISLLLWSKIFATVAMWHHASPHYWLSVLGYSQMSLRSLLQNHPRKSRSELHVDNQQLVGFSSYTRGETTFTNKPFIQAYHMPNLNSNSMNCWRESSTPEEELNCHQ